MASAHGSHVREAVGVGKVRCICMKRLSALKGIDPCMPNFGPCGVNDVELGIAKWRQWSSSTPQALNNALQVLANHSMPMPSMLHVKFLRSI